MLFTVPSNDTCGVAVDIVCIRLSLGDGEKFLTETDSTQALVAVLVTNSNHSSNCYIFRIVTLFLVTPGMYVLQNSEEYHIQNKM